MSSWVFNITDNHTLIEDVKEITNGLSAKLIVENFDEEISPSEK
jgi:hypothetical protein